MTEVAIRCEGLGKLYRIGPRERYKALRDTLTDVIRAPFRRFRSRLQRTNVPTLERPNDNYIWALKDVSFEVKRGAVVGIIGRNGAGKSTLLKILSRITEPTEGYAEIHGRVGSLLEVGTGFHPELTGRENIYLNGAIVGMKRMEIDRKFDEIVAFAEVEKFLDTPLKFYSNGMWARLAFAVAAHFDPEALLVDEVLAVGDHAFQKKCLAKMGDVAKGGKTVLFVSHQMNQIRRLCDEVIWINAGRIYEKGPTARVVSDYETAMTSGSWASEQRPEWSQIGARFLKWEIAEPRNEDPNILSSQGPVTIKFTIQVNRTIPMAHHGIALYSNEQLIWGTAESGLHFEPGHHAISFVLPILPLRPGAYRWVVCLYDEAGPVDVWDCIPPMIVATKPQGHPRDESAGFLNIPYQFTVQKCHSITVEHKNDSSPI